mmetsp:Transcript_39480/g.114303  ORF Transcript_39480/g.114303 Transcript_39480/m.114303 type:complete len:460 (+) Transcript_39480:201-1580(+)
MDEVVENVHAQTDAVLGAQGFDELEAPLRPPAPVGQLDEHGQGECARPDPNFLHLCQDGHAPVPHPVASASVDQRVVSNLIRAEAIHLLHVFQKLECPVHAILLAIPLDDGAVSDEVWLQALLGHLVEQRRDAAHVAAPGTSIDQRVVSHDRELHPLRLHLIVDGPHAVEALPVRIPLQNGAVDHGVDHGPDVRILQLLADERVGLVDLAVRGEGLHDTAERDARRQDVPSLHFAPCLPNALHVVQHAVCTHEAAERVRAFDRHPPRAVLLVELPAQQVVPPGSDASLAHGAQQHLVHRVVHFVDHRKGLVGIARPRSLADALQHDGASDVVRLASASLHFVDERPQCLRAPSARCCCIQQLVEGDTVWLQPELAHRRHGLTGPQHVALPQMRLNDRVVRDDVRHFGLRRLCHVSLGKVRVPEIYADVDHRIVKARALLRACLEDSDAILQRSFGGEPL